MKLGKIFLLTIYVFLFPETIMAQNLVPNGDFDLKRGKRNSPKPWRFINTVDFYVIGTKKRLPPGTDKWNIPKPKNGNAFVGLRIYSDYREFIQVKMIEKMTEGQRYYFEMWVSWSDHSTHYAKQLGASFYRKKPAYTSNYYIFGNPPQINAQDNKGLVQEEGQWMKISGTYRAKGGESYLSIGNFSKTHMKDRLKSKGFINFKFWHREAYYFVDAVSVVKLEDYDRKTDSILVETTTDTNLVFENENYIYEIEKDSVLIAENLQFESGSSTLLYNSYRELELIMEYLNENLDKHIEIIGHTDNIGSESSNLRLSENRAKTVYKYFVGNKIDGSRITYSGKGEAQPIESNETGTGRKANRRVELKLVTIKTNAEVP